MIFKTVSKSSPQRCKPKDSLGARKETIRLRRIQKFKFQMEILKDAISLRLLSYSEPSLAKDIR